MAVDFEAAGVALERSTASIAIVEDTIRRAVALGLFTPAEVEWWTAKLDRAETTKQKDRVAYKLGRLLGTRLAKHAQEHSRKQER